MLALAGNTFLNEFEHIFFYLRGKKNSLKTISQIKNENIIRIR